jgi:hypothetical protein
MIYRVSSFTSICFQLLICICLSACGTVSPDPSTNQNALSDCSDGRILRAALFCAGQPKQCADSSTRATFSLWLGSTPSGGTRINVQFVNGSRFQGSLITPDPPCFVTQGTDIDFTFGLLYTGDQGQETATDGSGRMLACIVQSKTVYSSFNFDLVGNFIHEGRLKETMHATLDNEVISQVWGGGGSLGRCRRWREMP